MMTIARIQVATAFTCSVIQISYVQFLGKKKWILRTFLTTLGDELWTGLQTTMNKVYRSRDFTICLYTITRLATCQEKGKYWFQAKQSNKQARKIAFEKIFKSFYVSWSVAVFYSWPVKFYLVYVLRHVHLAHVLCAC